MARGEKYFLVVLLEVREDVLLTLAPRLLMNSCQRTGIAFMRSLGYV